VSFRGSRDVGDELPDWLTVLVDLMVDCIEVESPAGRLGVRWGHDQDAWEVTIYPTPIELVGGAADGEVVTPGFTLDLERLREASPASMHSAGKRWGSTIRTGHTSISKATSWPTSCSFASWPRLHRTRGPGRSSACEDRKPPIRRRRGGLRLQDWRGSLAGVYGPPASACHWAGQAETRLALGYAVCRLSVQSLNDDIQKLAGPPR
jgi:hypothetical protein